MKLTVVGAGPAYTRRSAGLSSSCYLVEEGETRICFDIGQGSFAALGSRLPPESLTAMMISHLHPDHHIDLVPLRHYLRWGCGPGHSLALHAPVGLRARYDVLMHEPDFLSCLPGSGLELEPGRRTIGELEVEIGVVTHVGPSFAFRITPAGAADGPGLVYSGDCGRMADLLALVRPRDTLLSEAAFGALPNEPAAMHLDAAEAAAVARDGGASRLILTHVLDQAVAGAATRARRTFDGPVAMARPGLVLEHLEEG
ncbi:MAG TPA: MBL fold metallo-hydrolase [Candidatus Limnocylindrales bacterium]|nr:MBL fold metallo-hydrolase [Candidatus Limnocylindrales bacterium]